MTETILRIQGNSSYEESKERLKPPIPPEYFSSELGVPYSSIMSESWVKDDKGRLLEVKVVFSYEAIEKRISFLEEKEELSKEEKEELEILKGKLEVEE